MPVVTGVTPSSGPAGGGTKVVVSGEGFNLASSVTVGGTAATAQVVSDQAIHLVTPAHSPGTVPVVVTVGNDPSPAHDASVFTFVPAPVIAGVTATQWDRPNSDVTLHGAHLEGAVAVTFDGRPGIGFTVNDTGTELQTRRPPGPAGSTSVVVSTPGGTSESYEVWFLPDWTQRVMFVIQLLYVALLIGGLIAYVTWSGFRQVLPDPLTVVPVGVAWSGALGAVALSISGLVYHHSDWDPSFIYWHLSRPIIGAVMGSFAYLIVAAGVLASGGTPSASSSGNLTGTAGFHVTNVFYFVVAFLVGYREDTFRTLLQRFADVLIGPGETHPPSVSSGHGTSG